MPTPWRSLPRKDITPLARNEFICWVEDAKRDMTRERRIRRTQEELALPPLDVATIFLAWRSMLRFPFHMSEKRPALPPSVPAPT